MDKKFWVQVGTTAAFGLASLALLAYRASIPEDDDPTNDLSFDLSVDQASGELKKCSKERLLVILEDLQMEYTPYYTHYYHLLQALEEEYGNKPVLT